MGKADGEITLQVNGTARCVAQGSSLLSLLADLELDPRFLVVEYNGEPLHRDQHEGIVLADGDRLELVRPIAGG